MMPIAVYPGTFDPITFGHIDIISRAVKIFPRLIIAIAANQNKKPCFSLEERIKLTKKTLENFSSVEVIGFEGLLIDFMQAHNAQVIVRGIRMVSDFDYEFQLAGINRKLALDIESVFLMSYENYAYVSSSFVREIAALGGDISAFVPPAVAQALGKKLWL